MMKAYYQHAGITLYHGDCREVLPEIAGTADILVTDPPWRASTGRITLRRPGDGFGVAPSRFSTTLAYGDIGVFDPPLVRAYCNAVSYDTLILCGYMELQEVLAATARLRGVFVWHNLRPTPIPGPVAQRNVAFIVWGGQETTVADGRRWQSAVFAYPSLQGGCMATERIRNRDGTTAHPAQEPLGLFRELIMPTDGVILDPFAGTGTTLRAAKDLSRHAIGIEIEERYCEIVVKRLAQEMLPLDGAGT